MKSWSKRGIILTAMPILQFPRGTFEPDSDRVKRAAELRAKFLSPSHTSEIYGPQPDSISRPDDLMPDPDTLDATWGTSPDESIYDEMARNVLAYGALREKRIDVMVSLPITFLPGVKGDPESEAAREEIEDAFLGLQEFGTVQRALYLAAERGYSAGECVYDELTLGRARGLIGPVMIIDRPRKYFGFDYLNRPYLKSWGINFANPRRVDDFKVAFVRCGSLHTRFGHGYGPDCYPTVWTINALAKGHLASVERSDYIPIVVLYPSNMPIATVNEHSVRLRRQWKNVVMLPSEEVAGLKMEPLKTEGAYASANAIGAARMSSIAILERWLAHMIQGSQNTDAGSGAFAKEQTVSDDRLWKAPSDAAAIEAFLNRGLIEPMMLVNRPAVDRVKWPRAAVDASFGEDLRLFSELCESGAAMGVAISHATWHERTRIAAANEGDKILSARQSSVPAIVDPNADPSLPASEATVRFTEPVIRVARPDGSFADLNPDRLVAVDRGPGTTPRVKRAALIVDGDRLIDDAKKFVRAAR